jgi:uroporphyrinogen-III synthase
VKVLVLRAEPAASRTKRALERLGHDAILAPLFELAPIAGDRFRRGAAPRSYAAVIAASANAFTMLDADRRTALSGMPAMTVGTRTAKAARALGLRLPWPIYRTARELGAALAAEPPPEPILYLTGRERRPEIEAALRRGPYDFDLVEIYAAMAVPALPAAASSALERGDVGAALHYSARSAQVYVELARREGRLDAALRPRQLCLSAAVARPLEAAGAKRVSLASAPEEVPLLSLLRPPTEATR